MNRITIFSALVGSLILASQAQAFDLGLGLFKKKKPDPAPAAATPPRQEAANPIKQLMTTLQTDSDVEHRRVAAVELRQYDPRPSPEIISQLVSTMLRDPSPVVREAAAESLGAIKQVYAIAGTALEAAEKNDPHADVRSAAKAALWQYSLNGYRAMSVNNSSQTPEPPLSTRPTVNPTPSTLSASAPDATFRPITQGIGKGAFFQQSVEPPLAKTSAPPAVVPDTKPAPKTLPPQLPITTPAKTPPTAAPRETSRPPVAVPPAAAPPVSAPSVLTPLPAAVPAPPVLAPYVLAPLPTAPAPTVPAPLTAPPTIISPPVSDPTIPNIPVLPTVPGGTGIPTIPSPPSR